MPYFKSKARRFADMLGINGMLKSEVVPVEAPTWNTLQDKPTDLVTAADLEAVGTKTLATEPSAPVEGEMYYDTTIDSLRVYTNGRWRSLDYQAENLNCYILLQAGGGSGINGSWGGGGGGAGGQLEYNNKLLSRRTSYPILVGAGGATNAVNGANSTMDFGNHTGIALGGGSGQKGDGGCGGGGFHSNYNDKGDALQTGNAEATGYGHDGGRDHYNGSTYPCGTGGGCGGPGTTGGIGGAGRANAITGQMLGGGGGQCSKNSGTAGRDGGGAGAYYAAAGHGTQFTGSGGGGSRNGTFGKGGSGVVFIAYQADKPMASGGAIRYHGNYVIHEFFSSGTFTVH